MRTCKYCGEAMPRDRGPILFALVHSGLPDCEAVGHMPICMHCAQSKFVQPARRKYHADSNLNAVILWCTSREEDPSGVQVRDEGQFWAIHVGPAFQRLPKSSREEFPAGVIFDRLDTLTGRSAPAGRA